jgi:hypothetical protein
MIVNYDLPLLSGQASMGESTGTKMAHTGGITERGIDTANGK